MSQPGTQESLGTIPQHVCPVILVIASIRNPGDDNGKHCVSGALHRSQIVSWLLQNGSVASFFLGGGTLAGVHARQGLHRTGAVDNVGK